MSVEGMLYRCQHKSHDTAEGWKERPMSKGEKLSAKQLSVIVVVPLLPI